MPTERIDSMATDSAEVSWLSRFLDAVALSTHRIGGVLLVATVASRSLFPSEDASDGTGIYFLPLSLACGLCYVVERTAGVRGPRFRWVGWAWAALVLAWWASLLWTGAKWTSFRAEEGYRYPAAIMLWEWAGVAIVSVYARHWQATGGPKAMASLVVSIVLCQSLLSAYQVGCEMPQLRRMYEQNDGSVRRAMRDIGVEPGGWLEKAFRDRLYSNEPFGTTGHPNSLAGFLVVGIPMALTLAWSSFGRKGVGVVGTVVSLLIAVAGLAALVATKSRSAWVAVVVSLAVLMYLHGVGREWWRRNLWRVVGGAAAMTVVVGTMSWFGLLDTLVLRESVKSMQYRWEWWQASAKVIAEQPLFGVGAGNFRDYYLAYKLPFSSEEIADPHNFVLELLATGGCLSLAAYLAVLAFSIRGSVVASGGPRLDHSVGLGTGVGWITGCFLAALAVIWLQVGIVPFVTQPGTWPKIVAFVGAVTVVWFVGWTGVDWSGSSIRRAGVAGAVGIHVHWLAAGGVGFPSQTLLTFALLGACNQEENDPRPVPFRANALAAGLVAISMVVFAFVWLVPALERDLIHERIRKIEVEIEKVQGRIPPSSVAPLVWLKLLPYYEDWTNECDRYAKVIPGDRGGWERLAHAQAARMRLAEQLASPSAQNAYESAVGAWLKVLELAPRRSESYRQLALLYREAAASGRDPKAMPWALEGFRRSLRRYPNSARQRWELGEQYSKMNRKSEAAEEFRRALWLDGTPHLDRKLSEGQRKIAQQFLSSEP